MENLVLNSFLSSLISLGFKAGSVSDLKSNHCYPTARCCSACYCDWTLQVNLGTPLQSFQKLLKNQHIGYKCTALLMLITFSNKVTCACVFSPENIHSRSWSPTFSRSWYWDIFTKYTSLFLSRPQFFAVVTMDASKDILKEKEQRQR